MKLKTKFQDEDFDLGEGADVDITTMPDGCFKARAKAMRGGLHTFYYNTKADFDADWEDYKEEPKEYWCIDWTGGVNHIIPLDDSHDKYENNKKEIGNYFETKEEAEKAVEKLKAWQRLKDNGFRFVDVRNIGKVIDYDIPEAWNKSSDKRKEIYDDLVFLFKEVKNEIKR